MEYVVGVLFGLVLLVGLLLLRRQSRLSTPRPHLRAIPTGCRRVYLVYLRRAGRKLAFESAEFKTWVNQRLAALLCEAVAGWTLAVAGLPCAKETP
ncbi:MAG: hypothetical protein ABIR36_11220 [Nitrospiraceae bacterium]